MSIALSNAPVSWGVDYADDPGNPPWPKVMSEIAEAGYSRTELGPYGYYPKQPARLRQELKARGLAITAGFVFEKLHEPAEAERILQVARDTIGLLSAVGGRYLVTIDHISPVRMATAGRKDLASKLDAPRFQHMIDLINRIADLALERNVKPVIHQHAGCYIEFEEEVEAVLAALDPAKVGVCIDTGHMAYAGVDPIGFYRRNKTRIDYFHFKDVDASIHDRVTTQRIPFLEAVAQKIFCPMGKGLVDWPTLASALSADGYEGTANVEQDIDPLISLNPLEDAKSSFAYLRSVGF